MMPAVSNLSFGDEIASTFTIVFAKTEPLAGREIVAALHHLAELVTGILEMFKTHCEAREGEPMNFTYGDPDAKRRVLIVGTRL